jgi:hypothetical protein
LHHGRRPHRQTRLGPKPQRNQQKVFSVGRYSSRDGIACARQPTRGVDVGGRRDPQPRPRSGPQGDGRDLLFHGLDEILNLADVVTIFLAGRLGRPKGQASVSAILADMTTARAQRGGVSEHLMARVVVFGDAVGSGGRRASHLIAFRGDGLRRRTTTGFLT